MLLAPLGLGRASDSSALTGVDPQAALALVAGGDQLSTSQTGDLTLIDSNGDTETMSGIKRDATGKITQFTVGLTTYKWSKTEGVYNPTTIEMNYYKFKRLSPGVYSWEKLNANGDVLNSGSLTT